MGVRAGKPSQSLTPRALRFSLFQPAKPSCLKTRLMTRPQFVLPLLVRFLEKPISVTAVTGLSWPPTC